MNKKVLFSSSKTAWETPQWLFDTLDKEFGFTLDVCADEKNKKCDNYFSKKDNGLTQDWSGVAFVNPPYGPEIKQWIEKAYIESQRGVTVVCLIAARTDTVIWHKYVMKAKEIRFVKGRIKFVRAKTGAPFPSAIVVFEKGKHKTKVSSYELPKGGKNE